MTPPSPPPTPTRIGIIGAGPAGLAALRTILSSPEHTSGSWLPTLFESLPSVGGVWHPSTSSPIYDSLTTNLPHPIMAFSSFPFPPGTPLFPSARTVQVYLEAYADAYALRPYILFNTPATKAEYRHPYWHVNDTHTFSLLIICNGHHNTPRLPRTPGLSTWLAASPPRASHSQSYRNPSSISLSIPMKECSILVVGSGPSGLDISSELLPLAKRVFLSTSTGAPPSLPSKCIIKPRATFFSSPSPSSSTWEVTFADGTTEQIDYCILATGYAVSFPFFPTPSDTTGFSLSNTPIPSALHLPIRTHTLSNTSYSVFPLARHLFGVPECGFAPSSPVHDDDGSDPLPPPTSLAFPGLLVRVAPLPVVEAQARAVLAVFRAASSTSSSSSSLSASSHTHNRDRDPTTTHNPQINWPAESERIHARHALLLSKFNASLPPSSSSPSLSPPAPSSLNTTPSPAKVKVKDKNESADTPLQTYLSHEWHRFDPLDQFTYRDELDDLVISLSPSPSFSSPPSSSPSRPSASAPSSLPSTSTSTSSSLSSSVDPQLTSPPPPPHTPPTRTRPWERPLYLHKQPLRDAWRLLESRGSSEEWVRGVGAGLSRDENGRQRSAEEEWVALMWRVLEWWEEENKVGGRVGEMVYGPC